MFLISAAKLRRFGRCTGKQITERITFFTEKYDLASANALGYAASLVEELVRFAEREYFR